MSDLVDDKNLTIRDKKPIINNVDAGWSSLEARRAHNPEVIGSNPIPAIFSEMSDRMSLFYITNQRKSVWRTSGIFR